MAKAVKKRGPGRPKKGEEIIPNNGRPTVMTPETIKQLETAFMLGCTDLQACLAANIGMSTLYEYQVKNPEFAERKKLLKENPIYLARQSVVRGIQTNERLAFDYLKAREHKEFAEKTITEHSITKESLIAILAALPDGIREEVSRAVVEALPSLDA